MGKTPHDLSWSHWILHVIVTTKCDTYESLAYNKYTNKRYLMVTPYMNNLPLLQYPKLWWKLEQKKAVRHYWEMMVEYFQLRFLIH